MRILALALLVACGGGEGGDPVVPCGLLGEPAQCEEPCRDLPSGAPASKCTASNGSDTKECSGVFDTDGRRGCCDSPRPLDELTESDLVHFFECE